MTYELRDEFAVTADLERTWAFFSTAENLPRITPPRLGFRNVRGPGRIESGSELDYTIRWMGLPLKWRTWIVDWEPPRRFVDLQVRGPYAMWHHEHRFAAVDGGTRCEDRVLYRLPFPPLGRVVHPLVVRGQLLEIFRYRRKVIAENLGWSRAILEDVTIRAT